MARPKSFQLENKVLKNKLNAMYGFIYGILDELMIGMDNIREEDNSLHLPDCESKCKWDNKKHEYYYTPCDCEDSTLLEAKKWLETNTEGLDQLLLPIK